MAALEAWRTIYGCFGRLSRSMISSVLTRDTWRVGDKAGWKTMPCRFAVRSFGNKLVVVGSQQLVVWAFCKFCLGLWCVKFVRIIGLACHVLDELHCGLEPQWNRRLQLVERRCPLSSCHLTADFQRATYFYQISRHIIEFLFQER